MLDITRPLVLIARMELLGMNRVHRSGGKIVRRFAVLLAVAMAALFSMAGGATGRSETSYVVVATGRVAGQTWQFATVGRGSDSRCYRLSFEDLTYGEVTSCESVHRPMAVWRRVIGIADDSAAIELDVVAPNVRRLKLLVGHPGRHERPSEWQSMQTRLVSAGQAERANVDRQFRFAVLASRGSNLCVEEVRAFSGADHLLKRLEVPCEF
jgi:hypothetical protein